MTGLRWMVLGMLATVALGVLGGVTLMYSGLYNIAVSSGHSAPVYWMLEQGMRSSVRRHAAGLVAPPVDEAMLGRGAQCFDVHCVQCHGGPGKAPSRMSLGMLPTPGSLVPTGREWPVPHIYWVARNGIRMAGMPAWEYRLDDDQLWAIASFIRHELPRLGVEDYARRVVGAEPRHCGPPAGDAPPDVVRGLVAMRQYGCHGCHEIPGVTGPQVHVGPALAGFARQPLIAGVIANTPENLQRWLRSPRDLRPRTLMPDLGVTEQHARDMAAYLSTLQ